MSEGNRIKVLMVEAFKPAREEFIGASLEEMQEAVGGLIEVISPFDDDICLVCNEEGKINNLPLNRAIKDGETIMDIIAGTFFICGAGEEDFTSLNGYQVEKYMDMFKWPEVFYRTGDGIHAMNYLP